MAPNLALDLLGRFRLVVDGALLNRPATARLQSLLGFLALHMDSPPLRQRLAFLFWPDTREPQARTNLRNLLYQLRHTLPEIASMLDLRGSRVAWSPDLALSVDVVAFQGAFARGAFAEAVGLYSGDLLPDCFDDWVLVERERLHELFIEALERVIVDLEDRHLYTAAVAEAHRLLSIDPLHEDVYRCLLRLYAIRGDRAAALRTYQDCETLLKRELGVAPSAPTRELYEKLLAAG